MTQMSEPHDFCDRDFAANSAKWLEGSGLARALHVVVRPVGVLVLLVSGCVIPPSLSVDNQDAGVNSPPTITTVRSEDKALSEADPLRPAILSPGEGSLNVSMLDTDQTDTLYVRVFVNYTADAPSGERASCTASPVEMVKRSCTVDAHAVCFPADVTSGDTLNMTVVVFDRMPLESGEPAHQAMPEGGLATTRFYFLNCQP
jgi:hypothetical protein